MSATNSPERLDRRERLGKRGDVAAGKDVFRNERIGGGGTLRPADGVQNHDPVGSENFGALAEIRLVIADADVLPRDNEGVIPVEALDR